MESLLEFGPFTSGSLLKEWNEFISRKFKISSYRLKQLENQSLYATTSFPKASFLAIKFATASFQAIATASFKNE